MASIIDELVRGICGMDVKYSDRNVPHCQFVHHISPNVLHRLWFSKTLQLETKFHSSRKELVNLHIWIF